MDRDAQLIERAQHGDGEAFAELVEPRIDALLRRACSIVRDPDEAEDLLQETLLRSWVNLPSYRGQGPFSAWMYAILRNTGLNALRSRALRGRVRFLDSPPECPDPRCPETHTIAGERLERVGRRFRQLTEEQQEVFALRMVSRLTFREIAERQGVPLNTALGRMHSARRHLNGVA